MYIDEDDLARALAALPEEAWDNWTVDHIAQYVFDFLEDLEDQGAR